MNKHRKWCPMAQLTADNMHFCTGTITEKTTSEKDDDHYNIFLRVLFDHDFLLTSFKSEVET